MARLARLLVAALLTGFSTAAQTPDAAQVLADMRQALGGDAIAAVRAFSVDATENRILGRVNIPSKVKWVCVLPDLFVQIRRVNSGAFTITTGFNGDQPVRVFEGSLNGMRPPAEMGSGTPEEQAARRRATVTASRQQFSRFVMAMLGITPVYPLDAAYVVQETLDGRPVHVIELSAPDGYLSRLYVDTATHLPRMVNWMGLADPDVTQPLRSPFDLPLVERRIYFSDYKQAEGLNWPHLLKEVVGRTVVGETRLGKFNINPQR